MMLSCGTERVCRGAGTRLAGGRLAGALIYPPREAAREARVPLLSAYDARAERWDAHPGIQGGADVSNAIFDCAHSSLAPGVYDGEVISLVRLLEAEAAEDVARTQL